MMPLQLVSNLTNKTETIVDVDRNVGKYLDIRNI